ncbi:unnamed protein product [Cylindrotheca closterium]|uniref:Leucine-rich repeat domain-containing protein n=1 Tax=Cylindrotheca closterium TaxID=2856 RepID=A0AAD2G233_9STRA|nr:unnamed protein product [Cylindrotheca closterium]
MTSFTYSGEEDGRQIVPIETECLTIAETIQVLPIRFCNRHHDHLQEVVFSSGISLRCIPDYAFYHCRVLRDIVLPPTVTAIGDFAFGVCKALAEFKFPEGLKTIGRYSFANCGMTHLRMPALLEVITERAFAGCDSLRDAELPDGLKVIGVASFCACAELAELRLPSTVEIIEGNAFAGCSSLETADFPKGLKQIGRLAYFDARSLESVAIPSSVKEIEEGAFSECSSLKEVVLVNGYLRVIEAAAFASCSSLQSIRIPLSVDDIGYDAFANCTSLVSVEFPEVFSEDFTPEFRGGRVFSDCTLLTNIAVPPSIELEESTFGGCTLLEEAFGETSVIQGVRSRFSEYEAHKACYNGSEFSLIVAIKILRECSGPPRHYDYKLFDPFGMTPFHILLSAAKKKPDLLDLLLKEYPSLVLGCTNLQGIFPVEYLLSSWTRESRSFAQTALEKWMVHDMASWGLEEWRSSMSRMVDSVLNDDLDAENRRNALREAHLSMMKYELKEATSLLEMWLWKMEMHSVRNGAKRMALDRPTSRSRCGATFIIPMIVDYLWAEGCWYWGNKRGLSA